MQGEDADQYEIIDYKYTHRLAQRPGSYVILKYRRDVVRHKADKSLSTAAAPSGLFDRSFADVSFIAGILVEKYRYHLPLYRQHQRLEASGITVSRGTLTNLEQRAGDLLKPVANEVLDSCLESQTLALDETPTKAGLKSKGKMKKGYFWCFYGDRVEMAFLYSSSRSCDVVEPYLKEFEGVLHRWLSRLRQPLLKIPKDHSCRVLDTQPALLHQVRKSGTRSSQRSAETNWRTVQG